MEEWRWIIGAEGTHQVSDLGRIRSFFHPNGKRMLEQPRIIPGHIFIGKSGRPESVRVTISGRTRSVHRLVLEAFVGPCPTGLMGCHNDGDATRNVLENLRWDTALSNAADAIKHGVLVRMRGELNGYCRLSEDDVRCIRAEPPALGIGKMLADAFGVSQGAISNIRAGKGRRHDGWALLGHS